MPRSTDPTAATAPADDLEGIDDPVEPPATGAIPLPAPAEPDPTGDSTAPAEATLDSDVLNAANGDANVWGAEFGRFLAALTGSHIDEGSLAAIFGAYALQVQVNAYRQAAIAVANSPIRDRNQGSNVVIAQMDVRADIAELLLQTAG